jgi:hypothetical protein
MSFTYVVLWTLAVWNSGHTNLETVQTYSTKVACEQARAQAPDYLCVPRVVNVN